MTHISLENVHFGYTADTVLDGVNLKVESGDLVSIYGENGSGKSTLLKIILKEIKPNKGVVKLLDKENMSLKDFKEIGYVPQVQNFNHVAFPVTLLELVVLNLYREFGFIKIPRKKHKEKAKEILIEMGLGEYINTPFNELSGGMKQRAMISRAMINDPKILVLDEPTAGVDKESKANFLRLIQKMNDEKKLTIVIVTHELDLVSQHLKLNHVYKMEEGRLTCCNTVL